MSTEPETNIQLFTTLMHSNLLSHRQLLDTWKAAPRDVRIHIQTFYKSRKPTRFCVECRRVFYRLLPGCGGPTCQLCLEFEG